MATKLGIDDAACRKLRGDIIYCNTYAYGLPDPLGRFGGLDPLYQASAGLEYESGAVGEGNAPLYYRFGMCDASDPLLSVVGVLIALVHHARTGEGQELWTSLHDGGLVFSSDVWVGSDGTPWNRPHLDADLQGVDAVYRLYATQDDDWICIATISDGEWRRVHHSGVARLAHDAFRDRGGAGAASSPTRIGARTGFPHQDPALLVAAARRRRRAQRGARRHLRRPGGALGRRQRCARSRGRIRAPAPGRGAPERPTHQPLGHAESRLRPSAARGPAPREVLEGADFSGSEIDELLRAGVVYAPDAGLVEYRERFRT